MIELTPSERRRLRAAAHSLSPVVSIAAKGLTEAVLREIDRALVAHQLIKVRVYGQERKERADLLATIAERLACAPVQQIGNILVFWRPPPVPAKDSLSPPSPPQRRGGKAARGRQQGRLADERQARRRGQT